MQSQHVGLNPFQEFLHEQTLDTTQEPCVVSYQGLGACLLILSMEALKIMFLRDVDS
jgi:hypothetical protein